LFTIQQAFYNGDYNQVVNLDISGLKESNKLKASVLVARAKIYLGKAKQVSAELSGNKELEIVREYADYKQGRKNALANIEKIIEKQSTNEIVQFIGGLALVAEGRHAEALTLLRNNEGSLECISLIVQIYLAQNRVDLAIKQVQEAKTIAQDNIVFNLSEAWVNLRKGGQENYQSAYYIFDELSSGAVATVKSLVGQAVAELQLGRVPEAEQSLARAAELEPENPDVLCNSIVAATLSGKDIVDLESKLEHVQKDHPSLIDLEEKSKLFDKVVAKYSEAV
jgi:coatomer protein complex subunit epsilon